MVFVAVTTLAWVNQLQIMVESITINLLYVGLRSAACQCSLITSCQHHFLQYWANSRPKGCFSDLHVSGQAAALTEPHEKQPMAQCRKLPPFFDWWLDASLTWLFSKSRQQSQIASWRTTSQRSPCQRQQNFVILPVIVCSSHMSCLWQPCSWLWQLSTTAYQWLFEALLD